MADQKHLGSQESKLRIITGGNTDTGSSTRLKHSEPTPSPNQLAGGLLTQLTALADAIDQDIAVILGL